MADEQPTDLRDNQFPDASTLEFPDSAGQLPPTTSSTSNPTILVIVLEEF